MKSAWKIIRNLLAVAGAIMVFGSVGASDFYVIELGKSEPLHVWRYMVIGAILMSPMLLNLLYIEYKEKEK